MSAKTPSTASWLPPQKEALSLYLDSLLHETWDEPLNTFEPVDLAPAAEAPPTPETPAPVAAQVTPSPATACPPEGVIPFWAATPFQAQLFQVAGLTLALPVAELVGVVDSTDIIKPGADAGPWLRGRLCYRDGEIMVVDTARWVLPQRQDLPPQGAQYPVLVIANGRWGLACDALSETITVDPAEVRWRTARTQRRWLAGIVSQRGCALLDPAEFAALLNEALAAGRAA